MTQEEDGRIIYFFFLNLITKEIDMRDWCVEHRVKSVIVPWLGRSLDKLDSKSPEYFEVSLYRNRIVITYIHIIISQVVMGFIYLI